VRTPPASPARICTARGVLKGKPQGTSMNDGLRTISGATGRGARVLVIDDEAMVAQALCVVLADEFDVRATTDPREALAWLTSGDRYDVVLCDVMMPHMNGVELRNRVHGVAPEAAARIVFITGGILHERVRRLIESVPNTCLEKPIDMPALRDLIRRRTRREPRLEGVGC
jgi:CheY-like chemotaxis protein